MSVFRASVGMIGVAVLAGAMSALVAGSVSADPGPCNRQGCTFSKVGPQRWAVPPGVHSIRVDLYGAQGGDGDDPVARQASPGGKGGRTAATFTVTPGQVFQITIGGHGKYAGKGGDNGGGFGGSQAGGGGGATDIRTGGTDFDNRIAVAGGGGGTGGVFGYPKVFVSNVGGAGGGVEGTRGNSQSHCAVPGTGYFSGGGGAATGGGQGGMNGCTNYRAEAGSKGLGGLGYVAHSGGGGGGYFGGGGGGYSDNIGFGGGGGAGYSSPDAKDVLSETGINEGDGWAVMYFNPR